jgi:hypothetical protein
MVRILSIFNISPPKKEKFLDGHYYLDWYDTEQSQKVLKFQERIFDDYIQDLKKELGWKVGLIKIFSPIAGLLI